MGIELGPRSIQGVQPGVPVGEHQGHGCLSREFKVQPGNRTGDKAACNVGPRSSQEGSQRTRTARDRAGHIYTYNTMQARMGRPDLSLNGQAVGGGPGGGWSGQLQPVQNNTGFSVRLTAEGGFLQTRFSSEGLTS